MFFKLPFKICFFILFGLLFKYHLNCILNCHWGYTLLYGGYCELSFGLFLIYYLDCILNYHLDCLNFHLDCSFKIIWTIVGMLFEYYLNCTFTSLSRNQAWWIIGISANGHGISCGRLPEGCLSHQKCWNRTCNELGYGTHGGSR